MRVLSLSDGARRLINEMKKLRLSLIFNEQARARARVSEQASERMSASANTIAVGPRAPVDPEISPSESRRGLCVCKCRFFLGNQACKKFRPHPRAVPDAFSVRRYLLTKAGARGNLQSFLVWRNISDICRLLFCLPNYLCFVQNKPRCISCGVDCWCNRSARTINTLYFNDTNTRCVSVTRSRFLPAWITK